MTARRPTDAEYASYDGMHCRSLWRSVPDDWQCPVCGRTRRQILVWGRRTGVNAMRYGPVGWKAGLHHHHDHGDRWAGQIVICGGCNSADGRAKRRLGLPSNWSFTVHELAQFISATPNGTVLVDYNTAAAIYQRGLS